MKNEIDFATLYKELYQSAVRFVRSLTQLDRDEAEDIVSDVFLHLMELEERLDLKRNVHALFFNMLRNQSYDVLRRRRCYRKIISHLSYSLNELSDNQLTVMCQKEIFRIIGETVNHLPELRRTVFCGFRSEGKSYGELAKQYHMTYRSVEYNVRKATIVVRECVNRLYG